MHTNNRVEQNQTDAQESHVHAALFETLKFAGACMILQNPRQVHGMTRAWREFAGNGSFPCLLSLVPVHIPLQHLLGARPL